jgi:glycogen synthase
MRIAFITPEFVTEEYFSGGLANYVHRITKYLTSLGHEVHVIILSNDKIDSFLYGDVWIHPVVVNDRMPLVRCLYRRFFITFTNGFFLL